MRLISQLDNIVFPENIELNFKLSALIGSGDLTISYLKKSDSTYCVHVKLKAGLKVLPDYTFEGLSTWEKDGDVFNFISYEEKDFSKKIHKKYEIAADGLNYMENKKGVSLEREVQYFSLPENMERIFDPMSAITLFPLELKNSLTKDVFIFGKQRVMHMQVQKNDDCIKIIKAAGTNTTWSAILSEAKLHTNKEGYISGMEIPAPLNFGKVQMKLESQKKTTDQNVELKIKEFSRDF